MPVSRTYHFDFDHPVDKLWAIVSDTPRWGEASGFPKYESTEQLQSDGSVKVSGKVEIAGIKITWEEPPVNWIAERWFEQKRIIERGPISLMTTSATLEDRGETSGLELELTFETRNPIGTFIARRMVAAYEDKARMLLENADRLIRAERPNLFVSAYRPSPSALQRARQLARSVADSPYHHGLADKLIEYVNSSQEVDLWSMRPIAIARNWKARDLDVIELFLQSVRSGLLESRWDILCPRCRVSNSRITNMSDLPDGAHCDACNIDYQTDFARNVELSFSPSPAIRNVEYGYFCRSGPGVTPHIKGQCVVPPGERRSLPLVLKSGDYRLRTLEAGEELRITWEGKCFPEIRVSDQAICIDGDSPPEEIHMVNDGEVQRTLVIEEQSWMRDVLTAEKVTTMQAFRDLFSDQILRPGDEVSIRNIVFMFTDLVGSTSLYGALGDAGAYRAVREHFALLGGIVREHQGNIVKTVGDGIHAAFLMPENALRAGIAMQRAIPEFNRSLDLDGISIRIGLHGGSSIAVTLNERLDYYGEAVNLSARLEGQGDAGDITMSQSFAADPAISAILQDYRIREREAELKGIDKPVTIRQFTPLMQA